MIFFRTYDVSIIAILYFIMIFSRASSIRRVRIQEDRGEIAYYQPLEKHYVIFHPSSGARYIFHLPGIGCEGFKHLERSVRNYFSSFHYY